ncbi:MAG TPA: hypothetical protein VFZ66_23535 [Herpetosiphonaceae bacterium]
MQQTEWLPTDEEWCELCFAFMELSQAHDHLQTLLLADSPPSLQQLWQATSAYRNHSQTFFQSLAAQVRARVNLSEHSLPRS